MICSGRIAVPLNENNVCVVTFTRSYGFTAQVIINSVTLPVVALICLVKELPFG